MKVESLRISDLRTGWAGLKGRTEAGGDIYGINGGD